MQLGGGRGIVRVSDPGESPLYILEEGIVGLVGGGEVPGSQEPLYSTVRGEFGMAASAYRHHLESAPMTAGSMARSRMWAASECQRLAE